MSYGIPYMGSKQSIVKKLCQVFPKADNFYDLFGGGFSVTHYMILHRKNDYKHFHFNEIRNGINELIKKAINGEYSHENFKPKFVSREEFNSKKEDAYVKMLWSFGNNGRSYLFSKEIEPYKKSLHNAIVFNEFDSLAKKVLGMEKFKDGYAIKDKRLFLRNKIGFYMKFGVPDFLKCFLKEGRLEQLEKLQQLEQLEKLQQLGQPRFYNNDYKDVSIKSSSVIYCDIPYQGTGSYDGNENFNHAEFFDWASNLDCPVFISEYEIKDKRFEEVFSVKKRSLLSGGSKVLNKVEKLYTNKTGRRVLYPANA